MLGQGASLFGSMLVNYAVMWSITLETKSGVMATLFTVAGTLPMFLISPFGGVWADRYNKKVLIVSADATIAIVTLVMALIYSLGFNNPALLLVCAVARSLGQGVQTPAINALIPELAPREHLTRLNGVNGAVQSFIMFASPMIAGGLMAAAPVQNLLYIDAATAAFGIAILLFLVKTPRREPKPDSSNGAAAYFRDIREGLRYIGQHKFVKKMIFLSAVFNIMVMPTAALTPLQTTRNFVGEVVVLAFYLGPEQRLAAIEVVFFAGMALGGALMGAWGGFKNKSHTLALSTFTCGLFAAALGVSSNFLIYLIFMGLVGLFMSFFSAPMASMLQTNIEGEFMGRVFSALTMTSSLTAPLGMALWGPLGDKISLDWIIFGTGICIFLIGFTFLFDKVLLEAGR
jgi:DHA3 family macrolide efflux protein-like MFS transporter